jgi:hypothetical protein
MPKAGWKRIETALPVDSDVYRDLERFCEDMGEIDKATATRLILIAWSKARRGQLGQLWGFSFFGPAMMPSMTQTSPAAEPAQENGHRKDSRRRQSVAKSAVESLDLDF